MPPPPLETVFKLDGNHQPCAPHLANERVGTGHFTQVGLELATNTGGITGQVFVDDHVKSRKGRSRGKVAATEGRSMQGEGVDAAIGSIPQRCAGQRSAYGHGTAGEGFCQHQNVRHHLFPFTRK